MRRWDAVDWIVAAIAFAICAAIVFSIVVPELKDRQMGEQSTEIMGGVIASLVSIVSLYVGATLRNRADRRDDDDKGDRG